MGRRVAASGVLLAPLLLGMPAPPAPTVPGSTDPAEAAVLQPGVSVDRVARARLTTYYRVRRSPGSTVYVAATLTGSGATPSGSETDTLRLSTPGGTRCAESSGTWDGDDPLLLLGTAVDAGAGLRAGSDDSCRSAPELVVTLERAAGEITSATELGARLRVTEEPGVTTFAGLPPALDDVRQYQAAAGSPTAVRWSDDLAAPVTLTPGTWSTSLPLNRTVVYRVRLLEGQRAAVTVRTTTAAKVRLSTWSRSPVGLEVPQSTSGTYSSELEVDPDAPLTNSLTVSLPEVRYLNRGSSAYAGSSVPGYYDVAIRTRPVSSDPTTWPPPVPVTLAVDVRGTPSGGPRYLSAPTGGPVTATPEPSLVPPSPPVTLGAPSTQGGDDRPWGALGVLGLLGAAAALGTVGWRAGRRRR